jgi:uncharacterized protein (DUF885 family)
MFVRSKSFFWLLTSVLAACSAAALGADAAAARAPAIATLSIPGDPRFVAIARDVLLVQTEHSPDFASQAGLIDDAIRVPSFAPGHVAAMTRRLRGDMARLRALPWRRWSVDAQIDVRWIYANAERIDRELNVEQLHRRRPGAWLEPLANNYISILTYAPTRVDALAAITARVPALVGEMRALCRPTQVDAEVGRGVLDGIVSMLRANPALKGDAAIASLLAYRQTLDGSADAAPFAVVGAASYAWRLERASLLPWRPAALLALAEERLKSVDGELAMLVPQLAPPAPLSKELEQAAVDLDQASLLALYDRIQVRHRAAIEAAGFLTIPAGVGPVRARVTPDAMVPLTGDGGSMNPPPPFIDDNVGWWNVEHFDPSMPLAEREKTVREAALFETSRMGPYGVHEGLPGHHLQLAIARLNPNPLRSIFQDAVQNEGWALYAEGEMWEQGGLGPSLEARVNTLRSWRFRIRRVVYDVKIETGEWTLQQAADWKRETGPGQAVVDPDVRRAVNWPAQLICYFAGKEQILALKADYRRKLGADYSERRFHDELLALGSVPYVFARAKMLGEPVPGF